MSRPPGATVGGQAVLEGVMMRAPSRWAVAVRRPDGIIEAIRHELPRLASRSWAARVPFLRGVMVLLESLQLGFRALSWSAQKSGEEDEELTRAQVVTTMVIAVALALVLFIGAPVVAASFLTRFFEESSVAFVVIDGLVRIGLIVAYIWAISRTPDIKRVFEYHGAEHMTIHAYEAGDPLGVEQVSAYSPRHPRCGTSFIVIVAMVAFVVFLTLAPLPLCVADRGPPGADPGDRRGLLRGAQGGRRHQLAGLGQQAGHLAAGDHHQAACRRPDRGRHRQPARRPR